MSVNCTVRRARCDCADAAWLPVRNSSISVRILSGSDKKGAWSTPSTSRYRAPGMWSARYRPNCTGTAGSSRAWMTRVGAVSVGRIGRTSIRNAASNDARAIPGLALIRSNIPSWRIDRNDGALMLAAAPLPHPERHGDNAGYSSKFGGAKSLTASPTLVKPSRWAMSFTEVPGGLKSLGAVATWLTL